MPFATLYRVALNTWRPSSGNSFQRERGKLSSYVLQQLDDDNTFEITVHNVITTRLNRTREIVNELIISLLLGAS